MTYFPAERYKVLVSLVDLLFGTKNWDNRLNIEWYVWRCVAGGFCDTPDQIRLCAERYIAGKRKVNPPGTSRRKKAAKKMRDGLKNTPPELLSAIKECLLAQQKAVDQYKNGNDKALNSLVGGVMKSYKGDPALIRQLLIQHIQNEQT